MRRQGIVARGHFEPQHRRHQVFGQHRPHPTRQRFGQGNTRNRAVLHPLATCTPGHTQTTRLEVEHRALLGAPHQGFRAGTRGKAHFDAPRCICRCQKSFGPRRIIAIHKGLFGTIDRQCFGVGGQALHRQTQSQGFFDGTLGHHATPPRLGPHQNREGIERCCPRHSHRRLDFRKSPQGGFGGICRQQRRIFAAIGDVGLIGGDTPHPHFCQTVHHFEHIHMPHDIDQFGRRTPGGEAQQRFAGDVDIGQHMRKLQ